MEGQMVGQSILMLCKAFPPVAGGVETYSEEVARAYRKRNIEVAVITQTTGTRGWHTRDYPEGPIEVFNTGPGGQLATATKMMNAVRKATSDSHFDLYHATTWRPALSLVAAVRQRPLILTVHGREVCSPPRILEPVMRRVIRRADLIVNVSTETMRRAIAVVGAPDSKSSWIVAGNGITRFSGQNQGKPRTTGDVAGSRPVRILTLARLVERKNIGGCISALHAIHISGTTEFEYKVAGNGPLFDSLNDQIKSAGFDEKVELLGYVDDERIAELYEWADIFLHPQITVNSGKDFEGFGLTIADAMSFGCLAIAGQGAGPDDFIQHGVTGLLVDGSNLEDLRTTLDSVMTNFAAYHVMARAGQAFVTNELSWQRHVDTVLLAFEAGKSQNGPRPSTNNGQPDR
ncbi:glycosyltransferase family 4 protein [Mycolicibacterium sp. PDY-3]|uniref:glycosyltransferase family 4 protein n=1 Tax=Mycolicibacterium sp. PDY-3 TaxID=3376069 RepID=UPI0037B5639D